MNLRLKKKADEHTPEFLWSSDQHMCMQLKTNNNNEHMSTHLPPYGLTFMKIWLNISSLLFSYQLLNIF